MNGKLEKLAYKSWKDKNLPQARNEVPEYSRKPSFWVGTDNLSMIKLNNRKSSWKFFSSWNVRGINYATIQTTDQSGGRVKKLTDFGQSVNNASCSCRDVINWALFSHYIEGSINSLRRGSACILQVYNVQIISKRLLMVMECRQ